MRRLILLSAMLACSAAVAQANTIDFTQLTIDPIGTWSSGDGLTVIGDHGAQFSSVDGHGINMSSLDLIDLDLQVDGRINSFTIQPYQTIDGQPGWVPFFMGFTPLIPDLTSSRHYLDTAAPFLPITVAFAMIDDLDVRPSLIVGLSLHGDYGQIPIQSYLHDHPDAVLTYGFSMTSIDYTPTVAAPEPATILLLVSALALWLLMRGESKNVTLHVQ